MDSEQPSLYSIDELAELGGVSRRTVRYYVQRGLIPPPDGTGRGRHYGRAHIDALLRVKAEQEGGRTLVEILGHDDPAQLPGPAPPAPDVGLRAQETWTRVVLDDGVELHVRGRALPSDVHEKLRRVIIDLINGVPSPGGTHERP